MPDSPEEQPEPTNTLINKEWFTNLKVSWGIVVVLAIGGGGLIWNIATRYAVLEEQLKSHERYIDALTEEIEKTDEDFQQKHDAQQRRINDLNERLLRLELKNE